MILGTGICSVFRRENIAPPGMMPQYKLTRVYAGWYGERSFTARPRYLQEAKESTTLSAKIRVHQFREIQTDDVVVLMDVTEVPAAAPRYAIVNLYHDIDSENGQPITDIDLEVIEP